VQKSGGGRPISKSRNQKTLIRPKENACFVEKILNRNGPGTDFADAASN
jgi:hypothetical protein